MHDRTGSDLRAMAIAVGVRLITRARNDFTDRFRMIDGGDRLR